ncbi:MAG: glucokinase [Actinomycetota bacterium]|nr:glucokinase [Actinomycetota bacterium]
MARQVELTIGVDVGGTKIAAGVVDPAGTVIDEVRVSTPATTAEAVETGIVTAVEQLAGKHTVEAVGIAIAGFVDESRATLRFAPNLPMEERPLQELLARATGLRSVVENDANAAAWGEFRFGGGRGSKDMVLLTVGTGLGGGIVLDDRLLRGAFGSAGEVGHVRMVPDGLACGCGNRGCWEQYSSGSALIREARALARSRPERAARLLDLAEGDAEAISGRMVTQAAAEGDPTALGLLAEVGRWLGEGIADLADILDPAAVVVGGGVSEAGDLLLQPAREAYEALLSAGGHRPHLKIVAAELGNAAGLVGAADLARHP